MSLRSATKMKFKRSLIRVVVVAALAVSFSGCTVVDKDPDTVVTPPNETTVVNPPDKVIVTPPASTTTTTG
jgi:hypothetical protein